MAARSIVSIDVDDSAFKEFQKRFESYQKALTKLPGAWGKTDAAVEATNDKFADMTAALLAQQELLARSAKGQERMERATASTSRHFAEMGRNVAGVAKGIAGATESLLKWVGITSVISGLAGAGGIWGIDRLAAGASGQRRSALGIGATTGEQSAFRINYGRYVDTDSYLSSVNTAQHDLTQRWRLNALGLTDAQMAGKDTAQIAQMLLPQLYKRYVQGGKTTQGMHAYGVDYFTSLEEMQRYGAASPQERAESDAGYNRDSRALATDDGTLKKWQDLSTALGRAETSIDNAFVKGLTPLTDGLGKLSGAVTDAVAAFLSNKGLKGLLGDVDTGLEKFAGYLGSPRFISEVDAIVSWVGKFSSSVGGKTVSAASTAVSTATDVYSQWQSDAPNRDADAARGVGPWLMDQKDSLTYKMFGAQGIKRNNPGNLRIPGTNRFQSFASPEAGIDAMARQLLLYETRDHIDTISGIVSKWAPPGDHNDTTAYIRGVSGQTGFKPDQHLDLNNPDTLARLVSAMTKRENAGSNFSPSVVLTIMNNTGGSAIVTTSQVAH